jgi:predicted DNA-binding helix-hairpin-helix protein
MGEKLPTVAIKWQGDPGFLKINKADFDPAIHEPYEGDIPEPPAAIEEPAKLIDLNTADLSELMTLPSIGGAKANKLIANRPLLSVEDVLDKTGLDLSAIAHLVEFSDEEKNKEA